jgi:YfiH family protein
MSADELAFDLPGGAHALFTTRMHGNLSSVGGDDAQYGLEARGRLREQLGVRSLLRGYQVHGTTVHTVWADAQESEAVGGIQTSMQPGAQPATASSAHTHAQPDIEADGQATALRGLGAMVLTADCLPVALGASGGALAMVHAGWRGLAAGVLEEGVRAVRELGGDGEIVAIVGPGAGPCCYEVGEEVHAAFGTAHRDGRNIDLKAIARERLLTAGAAEVRDVAACTICDERFFSHRREGARAGRQGGVAWRD